MINFLLVFSLLIALSANIYGSISNKKIFIILAKPFLIPIIIFLYIFNSSYYNSLLLGGLVLGWVGDIFLIKPQGKRFTAGLIAFLAGHILYIILFLQRVDYLKDIPSYFFLFILIYQFFAIPFFIYIKNDLKEMKIPVLVYMSCIIIMSFTAFVYITISMKIDFWFPLIGSIFFLISDCLLAFSTFKKESKYSYSVVITTYVLAQLSITIGFIV